ncbi:MAG: 2-hydroxyacid dehydrogenase [Saprospiraceae bacterium]
MKVAVFSAHKFEKEYLISANTNKHDLILIESRLSADTVSLAKGCQVVSIFVSDDASSPVLEKLNLLGIRFLALRSAGFNHVDLEKAKKLNIKIARVPEYSPYAVAEYTIALMLALNRKLIRSHYRIMEQNFSLDGLTGFDMNGKKVGIIGTGKIGSLVAKILFGFGCKLLAFDPFQNESLIKQYNLTYTDFNTLCRESDIITLHAPLQNETEYIINEESISLMKQGVMIINTGRGGLVNTKDIIEALKNSRIGYFGSDVYEEEEGLFFVDHSEDILQDDIIARLMSFRNVLVTSHQAFLTDTALRNISNTTIQNIDLFEKGEKIQNEIVFHEPPA